MQHQELSQLIIDGAMRRWSDLDARDIKVKNGNGVVVNPKATHLMVL